MDVRTQGSGNAGATNVLRTAGRGLAAGTMLLDVGKGALAVLLMQAVTYDARWLGGAAVAAVLGHVFPVWFSFRGGKGVATAIGANRPANRLATILPPVRPAQKRERASVATPACAAPRKRTNQLDTPFSEAT